MIIIMIIMIMMIIIGDDDGDDDDDDDDDGGSVSTPSAARAPNEADEAPSAEAPCLCSSAAASRS